MAHIRRKDMVAIEHAHEVLLKLVARCRMDPALREGIAKAFPLDHLVSAETWLHDTGQHLGCTMPAVSSEQRGSL